MSESNPAPAPAAAPSPGAPHGPRKVLGLPLWLFVCILFAGAGVAAWQGGLLDAALERFRGKPAEDAKGGKSGKGGKNGKGSPVKLNGPVNINTASIEELRALPSVDEKIAAEIIKERPFEDVDDLKKVKGIGDKKLEKLKPLVTVE